MRARAVATQRASPWVEPRGLVGIHFNQEPLFTRGDMLRQGTVGTAKSQFPGRGSCRLICQVGERVYGLRDTTCVDPSQPEGSPKNRIWRAARLIAELRSSSSNGFETIEHTPATRISSSSLARG